jgi:hypothetical protein
MLIAGGVRSQKTQARYRDSIEGISPPSSPAWTHPLGARLAGHRSLPEARPLPVTWSGQLGASPR